MHGEGELAEFLKDSGLVSYAQLEEAKERARERGETLSRSLIESGVLGEEEVRRAASHALGIPYVVLTAETIDPQALFFIPEPLSRTHSAVAFASSERGVEVALLSLDDLPALDPLEQRMRILPRLTSRESLRRALLLYQKQLRDAFDGTAASLLAHARSQGAHCVHLEPSEEGACVRYRIGAGLHEAMNLSRERGERLIRELKRMQELRLSVVPTAAGERAVIHLLEQEEGRKGFTLESLGFHGAALELMHRALRQKRGLLAIVGPERSGITTTLYTLLDVLSHPSRSILSVEKRLEYRLPGVAQTVVGEGLSAAAAVRAALRQDPDILALSDIEEESALALAARASSHVLIVMGSHDEERVIPDAMVIRQRLLQKLCKKCSEPHELSRAEVRSLSQSADFAKVLCALKEEGVVEQNAAWKDLRFRRAEGCGECTAGYRGLVGIQEVRVGSEEPPLNLTEDGLFKAAQGLASIEEVAAVAQESTR